MVNKLITFKVGSWECFTYHDPNISVSCPRTVSVGEVSGCRNFQSACPHNTAPDPVRTRGQLGIRALRHSPKVAFMVEEELGLRRRELKLAGGLDTQPSSRD